VPGVFRKFFRQLALLRREQPGLELFSRGRVAVECGNARAEDESKKMVGMFEKKCVSLRLGERMAEMMLADR